jgi:hypothetical protein
LGIYEREENRAAGGSRANEVVAKIAKTIIKRHDFINGSIAGFSIFFDQENA